METRHALADRIIANGTGLVVTLQVRRSWRPKPPLQDPCGQPVSTHVPVRGRRHGEGDDESLERVSIHAPAQGRRFRASLLAFSGSFNPRPSKEATTVQDGPCDRTCRFKSRPPRGRRLAYSFNMEHHTFVSFHASRGRRPNKDMVYLMAMWFQPTPPPQGRQLDIAETIHPLMFQSTPPHGRRCQM